MDKARQRYPRAQGLLENTSESDKSIARECESVLSRFAMFGGPQKTIKKIAGLGVGRVNNLPHNLGSIDSINDS